MSEGENRGLYHRYNVTKVEGETDPAAHYFVLRLDPACKDRVHVEACRDAALEYAKAVRCTHLEQVGEDLVSMIGAFVNEEIDTGERRE